MFICKEHGTISADKVECLMCVQAERDQLKKTLEARNNVTDFEKEVLSKFKMPIKADEMSGYIFDDGNQMMREVRGWGYLQKFANGAALQEGLLTMFVKAFNEKYSQKEGGTNASA